MSKLRLFQLLTFIVALIGLMALMGGRVELGVGLIALSFLANVVVRVLRFLWRN